MSFKTQNDRRDAALEYVRRGWLIFPVPFGLKCGFSRDRHITDAPWGSTGDADIVRRYWNDLPNANIGIPMGIGSGIFDIECDTPEGHNVDGIASLAKLEKRHGKLRPTLMFVSPTGSEHRLFLHPGGDVRIRSGALDAQNFPGIDIRGDGSMSVAPPSKTKRGTYTWVNKRRVARAPAWLLGMVVKQVRVPREPNGEPADITRLTLAIAMVPNNDRPWDSDPQTIGWNDIGMALFSATGGSKKGLDLLHAFSKRSAKYNEAATDAKWKALHSCPPNEIGAGTIYYLAEQSVPDYMSRIIEHDPEVIALLEEFYRLLGEPS
jgi:hypothetical protein